MCSALQHFLQHTPSALQIIEHTFCAPGHSSIQEVDSVHSQIEKSLSLSEILSPVSFSRVLSKVKRRSMTVIQLTPEHFSNFQTTSQSYKFTGVPFTKVKNIKLDVEMPLEILFKESFSDEHFHKSCILAHSTRKKSNNVVPNIPWLNKSSLISKDKIKDLKDMIKYMPVDDRKYYKVIFKNNK